MKLLNGYTVTKHASVRMCERAINKQMVLKAMLNAKEVERKPSGFTRYIDQTVTVVANDESKVILTVYPTEGPVLSNKIKVVLPKETNKEKTDMLTFGQLNAIRKAAGFEGASSKFSKELGYSGSWFYSKKATKKLGDKMSNKVAYRVAERFPDETAKWLKPEKLAYLEKHFGNSSTPETKAAEVKMTSPTPVPTLKAQGPGEVRPLRTARMDQVTSVKRALVGVLNEEKPLNLKLTDDLLAKIVSATMEVTR